jgi:hypothetical protein
MSVLIEVLTLVMRRTTLEARYPGGTVAMLEWLNDASRHARWVVSDAHLVAASFDGPDLRPVLEALSEQGLSMEENSDEAGKGIEGIEGGRGGQGPDLVIVDGIFGVAQPCAWFRWARPESGKGRYSTGWLADTEPGLLAVPAGHVPGRDVPLRDYTRRDPAMVRLGTEGTTEIWLDTRTGEIEWQIAETCQGTPGPIMAGILAGFQRLEAEDGRLRDVKLVAGDAEELMATLQVGTLACELRVHTYEGQDHVEAFLFLPIEIPRARLGELEAAPLAVAAWMMDPVRAQPCVWFTAAAWPAPCTKLGSEIMEHFLDAGPRLMRGLTRLAESPDYRWLEAFMGSRELRERATGIPAALVQHLDELAIEVLETGSARFEVRDLLAVVGAQDLTPAWRDRIIQAMEWVGLDRGWMATTTLESRITLMKRAS